MGHLLHGGAAAEVGELPGEAGDGWETRRDATVMTHTEGPYAGAMRAERLLHTILIIPGYMASDKSGDIQSNLTGAVKYMNH